MLLSTASYCYLGSRQGLRDCPFIESPGRLVLDALNLQLVIIKVPDQYRKLKVNK